MTSEAGYRACREHQVAMGADVVWFSWEAATKGGVSAAGPAARVEVPVGESNKIESAPSGEDDGEGSK